MYSHETYSKNYSWPHTHVVKILDQYLNPIKSYDEKTIFDDFQKFRRALTEIAVTFPKLKISRQKFGF